VSRPTEPVPTPSIVTGIAAGRPVGAVWINELGGVTFAIAGGSEYVKVTPARWAHGLEGEVCRLGWRDEFFDAYGVAPDQDRMNRYSSLWEDGD
jgi:kanamycin kinase